MWPAASVGSYGRQNGFMVIDDLIYGKYGEDMLKMQGEQNEENMVHLFWDIAGV